MWCVKTTATTKNLMVPNHDTQTLCTEHLKRRELAFNPQKVFIKSVDMSRKNCVTQTAADKVLLKRDCNVTHMSSPHSFHLAVGESKIVRVDDLRRVKTTTTPRNLTFPNHDRQTLCTEHLKRRDLAFNPKSSHQNVDAS